jgi:hypothetical protein
MMVKIKHNFIAIGLAVAFVLSAASLQASEPGWWGRIYARGRERVAVESTPIIHRPYRPLHFYGNTIRRRYYRGNPMPLPRDVVNGAGSLVVRR